MALHPTPDAGGPLMPTGALNQEDTDGATRHDRLRPHSA